MEIKDYYLVLKKNIWLIISITIVFALVAYIFTALQKPSYQSSIALEIDRLPAQAQSDVNYYQYDNFYSSAVSASLANNMLDWLASASTVTSIFERAGYPLPTSDIKGLSKTFTVGKKQDTSSVVSISYSSVDRNQAIKIIASASEVMKEKIDDYNKTDSSAKFITRSDQPIVVSAPKQILLNIIITAFLGFVISLGVVSAKEALK